MIIPESVKEHLNNASYYLEAADKFPPPTKNAVHILLLLIGWENIVIANQEFWACLNNGVVDEKIYSEIKWLKKIIDSKANNLLLLD